MSSVGPIGRLGRYTATHFRVVALAWAVVAVGLGVFAPKVEHALSGAGWEATGSESVKARELVDRNFRGLSSSALQVVVHSKEKTVRDPVFRQAIASATGTLKADDRIAAVVAPRPGQSISRDGHTAVIQAGAAESPNEMVRAADDLKTKLKGGDGVQVSLTGASGMWSDFNEANRSAMLKSEVISWPVIMVILVLAFGSLVAAGLPLMLTILGLVASAGSLYLGTQLLDISIWAMNFALMFALGAGHRLRAVHRHALPRCVLRHEAVGRGRGRRDDGHRRQGRPVLRPDRADLADRGDARAEPGVPLDGARDHARSSSSWRRH